MDEDAGQKRENESLPLCHLSSIKQGDRIGQGILLSEQFGRIDPFVDKRPDLVYNTLAVGSVGDTEPLVT